MNKIVSQYVVSSLNFILLLLYGYYTVRIKNKWWIRMLHNPHATGIFQNVTMMHWNSGWINNVIFFYQFCNDFYIWLIILKCDLKIWNLSEIAIRIEIYQMKMTFSSVFRFVNAIQGLEYLCAMCITAMVFVKVHHKSILRKSLIEIDFKALLPIWIPLLKFFRYHPEVYRTFLAIHLYKYIVLCIWQHWIS